MCKREAIVDVVRGVLENHNIHRGLHNTCEGPWNTHSQDTSRPSWSMWTSAYFVKVLTLHTIFVIGVDVSERSWQGLTHTLAWGRRSLLRMCASYWSALCRSLDLCSLLTWGVNRVHEDPWRWVTPCSWMMSSRTSGMGVPSPMSYLTQPYVWANPAQIPGATLLPLAASIFGVPRTSFRGFVDFRGPPSLRTFWTLWRFDMYYLSCHHISMTFRSSRCGD